VGSGNLEIAQPESLLSGLSDLLGWRFWVFPVVMAVFLIVVAQYDFLIFHTLAELFAIIIAFILFALAWKTSEYSANSFLIFLACGYFWIGSLDLMHTLLYKGMNLLPMGGANSSSQFWIATRYFEAMLLLAAPFITKSEINKNLMLGIFGIVAGLLMALIIFEYFPMTFVDGTGLTTFKVLSEYVIIAFLIAAIYFLHHNREGLSSEEVSLIIVSIILTIGAELAFTFYVSVYGLSNMVGHIFKLFSYWFIFQAIVSGNLKKPYLALFQSEAYNRRIFDTSPIGLVLCRMDGGLIDINPAFSTIVGLSMDEAKGLTQWQITPEKYAADEKSQREKLEKTGACGPYEKEYIHKDGHLVPVRLHGSAFEKDGEKLVLSSVEDISDRKKTETAYAAAELKLTEIEKKFEAILDSTPAGVTLKDTQGKYLFVNKTYASWVNLQPDEVVGKKSHDFFPEDEFVHIEDSDKNVIENGTLNTREVLRSFSDGQTRALVVNKCPIRSISGEVVAVGTILTEITEMKKAEEQLRQSQKVEVLGQLTGGIGHDFNNLLQIISGNIELMRFLDTIDGEAEKFLDKLEDATKRGSSLTHRLLAFSRKQALSPSPTDVNGQIVGLEDMLRRTLGETVELKTVLNADLWVAMIDSDQFEHALINLAVNARDAMPTGGSLVIETANITLDKAYAEHHEEVMPGDYVQVAVTDSGEGIEAGVMGRVFEPFFTTKEVGKGSGLGLSMVFGFVKQSKGHIAIYSEVGIGTTVKVFLPRTGQVVNEIANGKGDAEEHQRGKERVLLVEDDPMVREVSVAILERQGYEIIQAADGREALRYLQVGPAFDLLFTDVVLPGGMNGKQIADEAKRIQPNIRVLFSTGYSENAIIHNGQLEKGVTLVNKPYQRDELLEKVRAVLDADPQ